MVLETEPIPFFVFLQQALPLYLKGLLALALVCLAVAQLRLAVRHGRVGAWGRSALDVLFVACCALALGFTGRTLWRGIALALLLVVDLLGERSTLAFLADLVRVSPRRVYALARLTVQESLRRKVLAGFGMFAVILLFALWFLDTASVDPAPLYLGFVMNFTSYLVAVMALLLSVFSIPADIKSR
ncbi:MAG TPA: hypothetical protein VHY20_15320, partial [Pirellulales bacterium]|nr:hypothetical protein [Pirellulales bacterium]